jgi:glycosyltransferase involved in cell wall biosynthesis
LKLSFIIPVYNVELFLEKCLRSCADQDVNPTEYEIIVINDGTKDDSLAIAEKIATEYSNIIIVSQENAGLSAARNKGLSLAKGDYIWFVDSDDWIKSDCLKKILDLLYSKDLDGLAVCAANVENETVKKRHNFMEVEGKIFSGKEILKTEYWTHCVPFTIYRRNFLRDFDLKFMEGIYHEDSEFTPRAYYYCKRIAFISEIIYYVYISANSITRSVNPKKAFDLIKVANKISTFSEGIESDMSDVYNNLICININASLYNSSDMDEKVISLLNKELRTNKYLFKHFKKSTIFKYRFEGFLFNLFPDNCVRIYKMMQIFNLRRI